MAPDCWHGRICRLAAGLSGNVWEKVVVLELQTVLLLDSFDT